MAKTKKPVLKAKKPVLKTKKPVLKKTEGRKDAAKKVSAGNSKSRLSQPAREAAECRTLAAQTMSTPHRVMIEHIAQTWSRITAEIENRK